jgi:hypothetical protein
MEESRIWGTLGILLALVGFAVIALDSEFLAALSEGHIGDPIVLYVVGVAIAAAVTVVIIGPNMSVSE